MSYKPRIGISLSGGGARGIAHLGMLKGLEEIKVKPAMITGTSAGSIVGAFYACGYSPGEIFEIVSRTRLFRILRPSFNWRGLLTLEKTFDFFKSFLPADSFDSLNIPLYICATNVENGRATFFSEGGLIRPVIASCAIPVIFSPVRIGDNHYMDGGIVNNLPVEPLVGHVEKIIGLHVNPVDENFEAGNMKNLLERTFLITINKNVEQRRKECDIFLEPYDLRKYAAFEFSRGKEMFDIGYEYVMNESVRIKKELGIAPHTSQGGQISDK